MDIPLLGAFGAPPFSTRDWSKGRESDSARHRWGDGLLLCRPLRQEGKLDRSHHLLLHRSKSQRSCCLPCSLSPVGMYRGRTEKVPAINPNPVSENGKNEDPLGSNHDKAMADRPTQPPMYRTILVMEENSQIVNILLHLSSSRFISRNLCLSFLPIARWSTSLAVQRMGFSSRSLWLW